MFSSWAYTAVPVDLCEQVADLLLVAGFEHLDHHVFLFSVPQSLLRHKQQRSQAVLPVHDT